VSIVSVPAGTLQMLGQVPSVLAVTVGPDHVLELVTAAGRELVAGEAGVGRPLREVLARSSSPQELLAAVDRAYRQGGQRTPAVEARAPQGASGVAATPLRDGDGTVLGVLLHTMGEAGPAGGAGASSTEEAAGTRARGAALQQLAEQLSRAATPSAIGRLAVTSAAELLGADAAGVYARVGAEALEALHATGWPAATTARYERLIVQRGRPLSDAVLDRTPIWIEDAEQWRVRYPEMAPVGTSAGFQATACLPLRVEDRDLGAVVFSFAQPRAFAPEERDFLLAVAAVCAQALDRARLFVAEQTARAAAERQLDRMTILAQTAELMETPLSVEERLQELARLAVPSVADWCAVHLVRGDRVDQVAVAHADPAKVAFVARLQERYPPDPGASGGAIEVSRTGAPAFLPEIPDEMLVAAAVDETHLELIRSIGMRAAVVVPLRVRGHSLGALTLVQAESGRHFDEDDLAFVQQLAAGPAVALDNARLYEQEREIAHTLQTALLPRRLPQAPGLLVAARYRPQSADLADIYVGGDLYDLVEGARPGEWAATIADVCGKGPEAAALTALIRHTVRADVRHGVGPAQVLRRLNAAMLREAGSETARFATAAHALLRVDPAGADVVLVSGGHLPALVLRGGRVETVEAPGTLLGVFAEIDLTETSVRLDPGDALILYTDGVTEARAVNGFYGAERLAATAASCAGGSAETIADTLIADVFAFQNGQLSDDVAVLVLQTAP
jgi:serine phosphatase RsbU (regulator of sigma subunit)